MIPQGTVVTDNLAVDSIINIAWRDLLSQQWKHVWSLLKVNNKTSERRH